MDKSGVIWVGGNSAAGKTTVGRHVQAMLRNRGARVVFLDGDNLRTIFGEKWGCQRDDVAELARACFHLASYLSAQNLVVVIAGVAMYNDVRQWVKENLPRALQVYLNVPEAERLRRDDGTKLVHERAGDPSTTCDAPGEEAIVIDNFGRVTPEGAAGQIVDIFLRSKDGAVDFGRESHWRDFYSKGAAPRTPSPFASHVGTLLPKRCRLIEIGCGNGRDSEHFARLGHEVTAIDPSGAAIDACTGLGLPAKFIRGTIADIPKEQLQPFDVAYSRFVLHAMPLREEIVLLSQLKEILKPGGKLFIECRSINDPMGREGEVISPTERIHGHYRRFIVLDELLDRLDAAGFDVEDSLESNGLAVYKNEDPVVIRITARIRP